MNAEQAIDCFAALAQETRLRIVRLLVEAGPQGLAAGRIGEAVGASSSNVSFHLSQLEQARLVSSRREARSILYSADYETLAGIVGFLMRDCCRGHPAVCGPAAVARAVRRKPRGRMAHA
jgi:DNA-binding transcriptional ArsR family regulator